MILLTGGAGFIGSHIVDALVAGGHGVRVLDSLLPAAHRRPPDYLNPDAEVVTGDVTNRGAVARALHGVDAVCHQAAMVGLGQNMLDVADYVRHNDLGTAVLLRELAGAGFKERLVLASSMVVYGEGGYRCARHGPVRPAPRNVGDLAAGRFAPRCPDCGLELEPIAVHECTALDPRSVYAATKVHQEHLCFAFSRETGIPVTALRYHNVYGPRMPRDTPYAGVAAIFASALAAGRSPRVFEDGRQLRDFVHVRDVARANVIALTSDEPAPGAFNIASGTPRSVAEIAYALAAAAGPGAPPPTITGEFRLGDVRHVFASAELAKHALGFHAREGFEAGMAEFATAPLRAA
jgi:dTDP-L-rhamnose 4-epimerase